MFSDCCAQRIPSMTKLLFHIRNHKEALPATECGVDIVDVAADDSKILSAIAEIAHSLDGKAWLSLTASLPFVCSCLSQASLAAVNLFRVKMTEGGTDWKKLKQFARQHKTVVLIDADAMAPPQWRLVLKKAGNAGVWGVMLESCFETSLRLTRRHAIADIGRFVGEAKQSGLATGLAGALEAPDIPRLLPYHPDILGFSFSRTAKTDGGKTEKNSQLIRSLIPPEQDKATDETRADLGTDRIFVSDFILPVHIGVYGHEHGAPQRVCFNVMVDVVRLFINPEDMSHIFSYDLILDGIRRLVSLGHVDLVETLAEHVAAFILGYPRVQRVTVRVEKLDLEPRAVGVEIIRTKQNGSSS